jgi:transposase
MSTQLQVETLDHLGLVAGVIDELGLIELSDEFLLPHPQNCISSYQVVKAMLLNCFGFLSAPLYLFSNQLEKHQLKEVCRENLLPANPNSHKLCSFGTISS